MTKYELADKISKVIKDEDLLLASEAIRIVLMELLNEQYQKEANLFAMPTGGQH